MILRSILRGTWRLFAVCDAHGESQLHAFLKSVESGDALAKDKTRLLAYLDRVAHTPLPLRDNEITHIIDREWRIWQTTRGGVRVLWFYDEGRLMILSHGFEKRTTKTPPAEIERAQRSAKTYFEAKKQRKLRFLEGA